MGSVRPEYMETLTVALSEDIFTMLPYPCVSVRGLVAAEGLIPSPVCKTSGSLPNPRNSQF